MSNIFDINRFWNFLLYDLRRARNNYGISMLLLGLTPVIVYMVVEFFSLIFGNGVAELPDELKFAALSVSSVVILLGFGSKVYGQLTEKRAGSDYLMIPASTTEKWISLFLVTCVAAPVVLGVLFFASDGLMGLLFPNSYGTRLFDSDFIHGIHNGFIGTDEFSFNLGALLTLEWMNNILTFTLGAICFKKAKVAKTLFCVFALGMVLSLVLAIFAGSGNLDIDLLVDRFDSPARAANAINWYFNISGFGVLALLLGGIFYRLRTIQH